jgi:predicted membrane protein
MDPKGTPRGVIEEEEEHKIATKKREDVKKTRKVNRKVKEIKSVTYRRHFVGDLHLRERFFCF